MERVKREIETGAEERDIEPLQVASYMVERSTHLDNKMVADIGKKKEEDKEDKEVAKP